MVTKNWKIERTIQELYDSYKNNKLFLYNQKPWNDSKQIDFIKHFVDGFPMPAILSKVGLTSQNENNIEKVVMTTSHGGEWLNAIFRFVDGEFSDKTFSLNALPYEERKTFMMTKMTIQLIQVDSHNHLQLEEIVKYWEYLEH